MVNVQKASGARRARIAFFKREWVY